MFVGFRGGFMGECGMIGGTESIICDLDKELPWYFCGSGGFEFILKEI